MHTIQGYISDNFADMYFTCHITSPVQLHKSAMFSTFIKLFDHHDQSAWAIFIFANKTPDAHFCLMPCNTNLLPISVDLPSQPF